MTATDGDTPGPATRQRSRGPGGVLAAAVALVLVFVAVRLSSSGTAAPRQRDDADPTPVTASAPRLFETPTRGTLADDERWVSAVAALDTLAALPAERHVALATEVPEERIALVLGRGGGDVVAVWLTGPAGAGPDQMTPAASPYTLAGREPLALWDVPELAWTGGLLIVVAWPGYDVTFAPGRTIDYDGTEHFVPHHLITEDGVAITPVGPPVAASGGLIMIQGDGTGFGITPLLSDRAQRVAAAPIDPADPRGLRNGVDQGQLQSLLHEMAGVYGLLPRLISPILLAAGPLGTAGDQAMLVGATLPTGATVAWLGVAGTGPGDPLVRTVATVPAPAGTALVERVLAVPAGWAVSRLPLPPRDGPPGWLVISGPRAGTAAEALSARGATLATLPLVDGAGIAPVPLGTAAIRVLDASGATLGGSRVTDLAD